MSRASSATEDRSTSRWRRRAGRIDRGGALARALRLLGAARHRRPVPQRRGRRISASTAPSATISPSSSSRSNTGSSVRTTSATSCSICPTRSWSSTIIRPRPGTTATTSPSAASTTEGLPREGAEPALRAGRSRSRRAATTSPANMPSSSRTAKEKLQARRPVRGGAGPDLLRALRDAALGDRRGGSKAINPSPYSFFINLGDDEYPGRRLAGDVRAGHRPAHRDLPDLRHDQARRRRDLGFRADPEAAQFEEGRVRADHVLRRRPQRQEPGLRAGHGARHRPAPDRDVFAADPHGRPHRGPAARGHGRLRRLPVATPGR